MSCCWNMSLEKGGVVVWVRRGAGIWIGVAVGGWWRISVVYSVHVHADRVGCTVKVDRVGFESSRNFLYESGVEVEGFAGLQVAGVFVVELGYLVRVGDDELGGETVGDDLVEAVAED